MGARGLYMYHVERETTNGKKFEWIVYVQNKNLRNWQFNKHVSNLFMMMLAPRRKL